MSNLSSFPIPHSSLLTPCSTENLAHINFINFHAAIAAFKTPSLKERPFIIAGKTGGQAVAAGVSPAAMKEGITDGMTIAAAQKLVKELTVIDPDPAACRNVNNIFEKVISRYAPSWQNDGAGNIFFDITGTRRLFGSPPDCVCRIQNEIMNEINFAAAAATGTSKLVCKVASRTIRPEGLIEIRPGDEASFLSHQDIALLPGLGRSLMKTIRVTGFSEIGELACLSDSEALSLFGKKGILLRDSALGIDNSPVMTANRAIESRADFQDDVIDELVMRGAIISLAGHAGLQMRRNKFGASEISLSVFYSDGIKEEGKEKPRRPCVLDRDIVSAAQRILKKTVSRRIRIRSVSLSLEGFTPLGFEPDLFEPETETKNRRLQDAVDSIQERYGTGKVTRGLALAAINYF
ncbi:MAG: DNA polymerase [Treponema sp.]|nr:DNA polymerase [Treponema sp.]